MRLSHILLGVAGAGLFCAGVVLARTSMTPAPEAPKPRAEIVTTPSGHTYVAPPKITRTPSALQSDLHDRDPHVRAAALADVVRDGGDTATMLAASRDPSPEVGLRAMAELGKLYAQGAISASELVSRVRDHALDEKVRGMALNGLGIVPSTDALDVLGDLALHGSDVERRTAVVLLANQDPNAAVPVLIAELGDRDEYVRSNAVSSLQRLGHGRDYGTDANAWRSWWQSRIVNP